MSFNNSELNGVGEFLCLSYSSPQLESLFFDEVKRVDLDTLSSCIIEMTNIDIDLDIDEEDDAVSESASIENEESSSYNSDDSYDINNAPRVDPKYQVDINKVLADDAAEDLSEDNRGGELLWDPTSIKGTNLHEFLSKTEMSPELIDDTTLDPDFSDEDRPVQENFQIPNIRQSEREERPKLCTREEAMSVLHKSKYNVNAAFDEMKNKNLIWSRKKRPMVTWNKSEIDAFERGMRTHHKEFALIKRQELAKSKKSIGDILHYYYVWKKLPRYNIWQNRNRYPPPGGHVLHNVYSSQSAPIKPDEPNRQTADPRLRNRPRVDYSQSSNGSHFWSSAPSPPSTPGNERKRKRREELEEGGESQLGVYDVSVYAGIDYEKLRQIKRLRVGVDGVDEDGLLDDLLVGGGIPSSDDDGFWNENDIVDTSPSNGVHPSVSESDPIHSEHGKTIKSNLPLLYGAVDSWEEPLLSYHVMSNGSSEISDGNSGMIKGLAGRILGEDDVDDDSVPLDTEATLNTDAFNTDSFLNSRDIGEDEAEDPVNHGVSETDLDLNSPCDPSGDSFYV